MNSCFSSTKQLVCYYAETTVSSAQESLCLCCVLLCCACFSFPFYSVMDLKLRSCEHSYTEASSSLPYES